MSSEGEIALPLTTVVVLANDTLDDENLRSFLRALHDLVNENMPQDTEEFTHNHIRVQLSLLRDMLEEP